MHLTSKSIVPEHNELGVRRLQSIIDHAEKLGIRVAFENTKVYGYLEYVFDRIKNNNMGICYDAGHCHCHLGDKFDWEKFKDRIFIVHLHDNDGSEDQHLLPFEGTIDWQEVIDNLNRANYSGPVIMESCYRNQYLDMSLIDFYKLSLSRAQELYNISRQTK